VGLQIVCLCVLRGQRGHASTLIVGQRCYAVRSGRISGEKSGMRFRRGSWRGALQSAWSAVCRRRTCCLALAPSAGRKCWAIRSVLDEPTIGYRTSRFRRPKTISHDNAIAASCASSLYSGRGREADVLMYPAALSARPFSIAKLFVPSCILAIEINLSLVFATPQKTRQNTYCSLQEFWQWKHHTIF